MTGLSFNNKINYPKTSILTKLKFLVVVFFICLSFPAFADHKEDELPFDEVSVYLNVIGVGGTELSAVIKGQSIYLSVNQLFDFLKIKNIANAEKNNISGFFINQQANYLIDNLNKQIIYQSKTFKLDKDDIIRTDGVLYLKSGIFGSVFGLNCNFNFRNLTVNLNTQLELPVIREQRQENMRKNVGSLKGEIRADTIIKRDYPLFNLGTADWSLVTSSQQIAGNDTRLNLNMGGIFAGGEANVSLNYSNKEPFSERRQNYLWRLANNDNRFLKQTLLGKIYSQSTSSIYAPIVGLQLSNTPTTYRRSFGAYSLTDKTEPGWIVELYVNNNLVDYKKADPAGFYTFQVPLVYGNSEVKLRFYGPLGEERSSEQNISIPFNFLQPKEFEYNVTAGIVEDGVGSQYARAALNYGLNKIMTIGGGIEYLSSITTKKDIPFVNTSFRLTSNLLLSSQYDYGVRFKNILTYRLPNNIQIEGNYVRYAKDQRAINNTYLEERKIMLSMPVKAAGLSFYSRMAFGQVILPGIKYSTAEWLVSGMIKGISTTLNTYALINNFSKPYVYSNISMSVRTLAGIIFTPQAQYNYQQNELISVKVGLEKHILKQGFLNLIYEENLRNQMSNISLGFRYNFSFAQAAFISRTSNNGVSMLQSARGSLIYDQKTSYLGLNNRSSVGRGGLNVSCFLDLNANGIRDNNEERVSGITARVNGGRIENSKRDTTLNVLDLEPYASYLVEIEMGQTNNISWHLANKSVKVSVNPNQIKLVELPVSIVGEVSGMVYLKANENEKGQGRITIYILNAKGIPVAQTITEADGYYTYLGLPSGDYSAVVDTAQLNILNMQSYPATRQFQIKNTNDGDVADGEDFILEKISMNSEEPEVDNTVISNETNLEATAVKNLLDEKDKRKITRPNLLKRRNYAEAKLSVNSNKKLNKRSKNLIKPNTPRVAFQDTLFNNSATYFNPGIALINGVWVYVIYSYSSNR
ncbi:MAG: hypothetical protein H7096_01095 [Flavobacterium sp.]|nr:hypothetical protein [Pedobacter sp.]